MTAGANRLTGHATLTVASNDLRVLCGAFKQLGYVVEELLATAGLQQSDLADPDARLPCTAYSALLNRAQRCVSLPTLHFASPWSFPSEPTRCSIISW
jgi:hypothetical protein